jgi:hypothetical protein
MQSEQNVIQLLTEIRDSQQKLLTEYSRVANEALTMQREAFAGQQNAIAQQRTALETQLKSARLYKLVLLIAGPMLIFLIWRLQSLPI